MFDKRDDEFYPQSVENYRGRNFPDGRSPSKVQWANKPNLSFYEMHSYNKSLFGLPPSVRAAN